MTDGFLDNLFHHAALVAFVEQAAIEGNWPTPAATRQRAYDLYESELANDPRNLPGEQ